MKTLVLSIIITVVLGIDAAAAIFPTPYDTNTDAVARGFVTSQIGGQVAGSNYTTSAQIAGSNYTTSAQIAGSNYTTSAQIAGSNYTTSAQISSSNFLMQATTTNWFVLTNGSDSNAGTASNASTAFRTIQKAVNTVAKFWYTNITPVTIQLGPGIYNENVTLLPYGGNAIITIGNETNANIAPSSGDAVVAAGPIGGWWISNVKLWATNGSCINASQGASIVVGTGVNFATANSGNYHMLANNNGAIIVSGNYTVSGGARNHYYATRGSVINSSVNPTLTISGTPAFTAFAACDDAGVVAIFNATFNGSATGKRFDISLNGVMHTLSGSATYFPGNAAGTTNSGAQYQ